MSLAKRVRRHRSDEGLSQEAFGRTLGLNQSTISRIERGILTSGPAFEAAVKFFGQHPAGQHDVDAIVAELAISPDFRSLVAGAIDAWERMKNA